MREKVDLEFCLETDSGEEDGSLVRYLESQRVDADTMRELGVEPGRELMYRDYVRMRESAAALGDHSYENLPHVYELLERYLWRLTEEALEDSGMARKSEARQVKESVSVEEVNGPRAYDYRLAQSVLDRGLTQVFRMEEVADRLTVETYGEFIPVRGEPGEGGENLPVKEG